MNSRIRVNIVHSSVVIVKQQYIFLSTYVRDPVSLRLRHLYQVEFYSFIIRYPLAGASVYCEHISSCDFLSGDAVEARTYPYLYFSKFYMGCIMR